MLKNLTQKQSFLLLYLLTGAFIVCAQWLSPLVIMMTWGGAEGPPDSIWYWFLWWLWPWGIPSIIIVIFFVVVAMPRGRIALARLVIPESYSPKHLLLLLWFTGQAFLAGVFLHNAIYALGIRAFGTGFWAGGDEAVFFMIALFIVPAGYITGAFGRVWGWAVVKPIEEMKAIGTQLPTTWPYFAPFVCYAWLWKFGKGIETVTGRRVRVAGVFALVFFLGIIGLIITRAIMQCRLPAAKASSN